MEKFATIEPSTLQFVKGLEAEGGTPIYKLSPQDARAVLKKIQAGVQLKLSANIQDITIPAGPHGQLPIRIIRPTNNTLDALPVIMYFHGGGWILGDEEIYDRLVRQIAHGARAAVVFVKYSRSPEAQYPVAIEEAYAATHYIAQHGQNLYLDPSHLIVVGDSVGGNMATVVTMLAKQRGGPKINFQLLFYPVTDATFNTPSYTEYADGPWLTKAAMKWFWDAYAPDVELRKQPTLSPLQASLEQLQGLPPALIITDENDVLRDEGEAYAHKLMQAGVSVTATRYLGTIHDFVMLNPLMDTAPTRGAISQACAALREAFMRS